MIVLNRFFVGHRLSNRAPYWVWSIVFQRQLIRCISILSLWTRLVSEYNVGQSIVLHELVLKAGLWQKESK